jgi:hypothetical protein
MTKLSPEWFQKSGRTFCDPHSEQPTKFHEYFAADLSGEQAAFMARSQVLNAADNFKTVITTPAWQVNQAGCWQPQKTESSTVSHPKEVANVIESAARAVSK